MVFFNLNPGVNFRISQSQPRQHQQQQQQQFSPSPLIDHQLYQPRPGVFSPNHPSHHPLPEIHYHFPEDTKHHSDTTRGVEKVPDFTPSIKLQVTFFLNLENLSFQKKNM